MEDIGEQIVLRAGEAWLVLPSPRFMRRKDREAVAPVLQDVLNALGLTLAPGRSRWRHHPSTRLPLSLSPPG